MVSILQDAIRFLSFPVCCVFVHRDAMILRDINIELAFCNEVHSRLLRTFLCPIFTATSHWIFVRHLFLSEQDLFRHCENDLEHFHKLPMCLTLKLFRQLCFTEHLQSFLAPSKMNLGVTFLELTEDKIVTGNISKDSLETLLFETWLNSVHEILHLTLSLLCHVGVIDVFVDLGAQVTL